MFDFSGHSFPVHPANRWWRPVAAALLCVSAGCVHGDSDDGGATSGKFHSAGQSANLNTRDLLKQMVQAYGEAASYADSGEFHIRTEEDGQVRDQQPIPFSVTFVRPDKLRMHVIAATVVCDGDHFWGAVMSEEAAGQILMLPAPDKLTLPQIFADRTLAYAAHGDFDFPIPQLELLIGEKPLAQDLAAGAKLTLLEDKSLDKDGEPCHRVQADSAEGNRVYWIDAKSHVLRRLEFPTKAIQEKLDPEHRLARFELWADFVGAKFEPKLDAAAFAFEAPKRAKFLKRFIGSPPEPPSPLLGKPAADFDFVDLEGNKITPESLKGKVAVFDMWATWCSWCFRGFPNLEKVYQHYKKNENVVIVAISNDDAKVSNQQLTDAFEKQSLHIPIARDPHEYASSAFQVAGLPTTIVLGADGSVQDIETGYRADLAEALPKKLERLLAGENLADAQLQKYQRAKEQYDQEVADAVVGATEELEIPQAKVLPASEPKTFKRTQLWSIDDVKSPGNLLIVEPEPGSPRILAIEGAHGVAELDFAGKVLSRHASEIPEMEAISFLRSGVDAKGNRFYVAFASPSPDQQEQQLFLFDAGWTLLTRYPEGKHPGLADVRLADLDGDGQLELQVGYLGDVGVQIASLEGKRLVANRSLDNVIQLAVVGPNAEGQSQLLCTNGRGTIVWLNHALQQTREISLPGRALLTVAVAANEGKLSQICSLSSIDVGAMTAVGIGAEGQELWSYELPRGIHQNPLETVIRLNADRPDGSQWLIAGTDGSLHFLSAKGDLVDSFHYGEALTGLATVRFDGQPGLLVATSKGITAWRVDPL